MEAISILGPDERCVRTKLQLFLRLWAARQKYEQNRPFGATPLERLRFHLTHLGICWCKVVQFQRVIGLEVTHFVPRDQFEIIYVVSAFVRRELENSRRELEPFLERWGVYELHFGKLGYGVNPFEFAEICLRCSEAVQELERIRVSAAAELPEPVATGEAIAMRRPDRLVMAEPV
jgi:hypothetical protein